VLSLEAAPLDTTQQRSEPSHYIDSVELAERLLSLAAGDARCACD
jgi:hypothetical protein